MIPAGVFNQWSKVKPVWYFDYRPTNSAKPLSGSMAAGWYTMEAAMGSYTPFSGDYAFGSATADIFNVQTSLPPSKGTSTARITSALTSQNPVGDPSLQGYFLDATSGTTFDRSRNRSLILFDGSVTGHPDVISFSFSEAGTYKVYVNTNFPSDLVTPFTSEFTMYLYDDDYSTISTEDVSFSATDRVLGSESLSDTGWYTNNVSGAMVFNVLQDYTVQIYAKPVTSSSGTVIGQIAIEKIN